MPFYRSPRPSHFLVIGDPADPRGITRNGAWVWPWVPSVEVPLKPWPVGIELNNTPMRDGRLNTHWDLTCSFDDNPGAVARAAKRLRLMPKDLADDVKRETRRRAETMLGDRLVEELATMGRVDTVLLFEEICRQAAAELGMQLKSFVVRDLTFDGPGAQPWKDRLVDSAYAGIALAAAEVESADGNLQDARFDDGFNTLLFTRHAAPGASFDIAITFRAEPGNGELFKPYGDPMLYGATGQRVGCGAQQLAASALRNAFTDAASGDTPEELSARLQKAVEDSLKRNGLSCRDYRTLRFQRRD